jgi:osmoprotectant transport system substrate-binding protein
MVSRRTLIKGTAAAPLAGSAVFAMAHGAPVAAQDGPVKVGSKDFTEQFILGNIYMQILNDLGIETEDKLNLGGTQIAQEALVNAEIDLYPEYTGTGLTEVLGLSVEDVTGGGEGTPVDPEASPVTMTGVASAPGSVSELVFNAVRDAYKEQFDLVWLERSPANNTQALAVKLDFASENNLLTISDLAAIAGDLVISAPADFPERQDGLLGLQRVYGSGFNDIEVLPVAPGVKYQALLDDQAQVVLAFGTDGQIAGYDLVVLEDDLNLWPPYNVAPVVRQAILDAWPDIADRFNAVTTSLTNEVLSGLNWRVDGDEKAEPSDVANAYLTENGFIGG